MHIWTIQPESLYEQLKIEKILHCNPAFTDEDFRQAYDWLARQMAVRIGPPPEGVLYPFWAWHTIDGKNQKPDLRRSEYKAYNARPVCLELQIPDNKVLLSDFDGWHMVLNDAYYFDYTNEEEADIQGTWFDSLPPTRRSALRRNRGRESLISIPLIRIPGMKRDCIYKPPSGSFGWIKWLT